MKSVHVILFMSVAAPWVVGACSSKNESDAPAELKSRQRPASEDEHGSAVVCGATTCAADEVCCNASCGLCAKPGQACAQSVCEVEPSEPPEADLDPDAGSIPEPEPTSGPACGDKTCAAGEVCCNASCGICTQPGDMCSQQQCEPEPPPPPTSGVACGSKTCATGKVCCNFSCGICTAPGDLCTQQVCP